MDEKKIDRRVRKTRAILLNGLVELMKKKDIKDISVKELSDLVDINRGTFYLHYNDIYDMFYKIEDELFTEFEGILDRDIQLNEDSCSPEKILLDIFSFLESHKDLAKIMIGSHGDRSFVNRLKDLVELRLKAPLAQYENAAEYNYYPPFIISGFVGVIENWLSQSNSQSPEEMAKICTRILSRSIIKEE